MDNNGLVCFNVRCYVRVPDTGLRKQMADAAMDHFTAKLAPDYDCAEGISLDFVDDDDALAVYDANGEEIES